VRTPRPPPTYSTGQPDRRPTVAGIRMRSRSLRRSPKTRTILGTTGDRRAAPAREGTPARGASATRTGRARSAGADIHP
jgi:hypothetical protein